MSATRYPSLAAMVRESADRLEAQGAYAFDEIRRGGCRNRVMVDGKECRCAVAILWDDDLDSAYMKTDMLLSSRHFAGLLAPGDVNVALGFIRGFHDIGANTGCPLVDTVAKIRAYARELDEVAS